MFSIGDRVGFILREEEEFGEVVIAEGSTLSIKVGNNRIVQIRAKDCWLDQRGDV
jgi:hypothetical protein